jgi:hypothetical protein
VTAWTATGRASFDDGQVAQPQRRLAEQFRQARHQVPRHARDGGEAEVGRLHDLHLGRQQLAQPPERVPVRAQDYRPRLRPNKRSQVLNVLAAVVAQVVAAQPEGDGVARPRVADDGGIRIGAVAGQDVGPLQR